MSKNKTKNKCLTCGKSLDEDVIQKYYCALECVPTFKYNYTEPRNFDTPTYANRNGKSESYYEYFDQLEAISTFLTRMNNSDDGVIITKSALHRNAVKIYLSIMNGEISLCPTED